MSTPQQQPQRIDTADLFALALAADQAQQALAGAVARARFQGMSWQEIGAALGVSKQAAHQRYRNTVMPLEDYAR